MNKTQAIERAANALKKYSKRSNLARQVDAQIWNVILAGGCVNRLEQLTEALISKYEGAECTQ